MLAQEFPLKWHAEVIAFRNPAYALKHYDDKAEVLYRFVRENIILNQGKAELITALSTGGCRVIGRMAAGDRGARPSNTQIPKDADKTRTSLYHEVFRQNIQTIETTTSGDVNEMISTTTFNAVDVPITSFLDQAAPMINEVGLVLCNIASGRLIVDRPAVAAPGANDADEILMTHLPFNSVPFKAEESVSITVRYKIFISP